MASQEQLQQFREVIKSRPEKERKEFIDRFGKLSDEKKEIAIQRTIEQAPKQEQQAQQQQAQPQIERQNIFGQLFNVPGATSRAAIQAQPALGAVGPLAGLAGLSGLGGQQAQQAARQGALQPTAVPRFQEQAIQKAQFTTSPLKNVLLGTPASAIGLAADIATSPIDVLSMLIGKVPTKAKVPVKTQAITKPVVNKFFKAIKPSTRTIKSSKGIGNLKKNAVNAVETIVDNKSSLKFADETGEIVNRLPKNLDEFASSIRQTKKNVFQQYNALKNTAGEKGAVVDLNSIADDLIKASAKPEIEILNPSAQKHAVDLAGRLKNKGVANLDEAQDMIELLNGKLKNFYANPNPQEAGNVVFDSALANNLRKQLTTIVSKETGPQFSVLKRQYGALNSIEESVAKRAFAEASKGKGVLPNLFDVFSVGDIIAGVSFYNPSQVARGATRLLFSKVFNVLNNPNKQVATMFKNVDKIKSASSVNTALKGLLKQAPKTLPGATRSLQDTP